MIKPKKRICKNFIIKEYIKYLLEKVVFKPNKVNLSKKKLIINKNKIEI